MERTTEIDESGFVKIDRQKGKTAEISWIDCLAGKGDRVVIATRQGDLERQYAFGDEYLSHKEAKDIVCQIEQFVKSIS